MDISFLLRGLIIGFWIAAPVGPIGVLCIRRKRPLGVIPLFQNPEMAPEDHIAKDRPNGSQTAENVSVPSQAGRELCGSGEGVGTAAGT